MAIIKKVANSDVLDGIFDIPENLKNKKVIVTIKSYDEIEDEDVPKLKNLRGSLSKYKNDSLREKEDDAWAMAVKDKYDNN